MTVTFAFEDDYLTWDATETVSHVSERDSGDLTQNNVTALRLPVTSREAAQSEGRYTTRDLVWLVPGQLLTRTPKESDRIVDDDSVPWVVIDYSHSPLDNTYRLTCKNLRIAADLNDLVDLYRPAFTADAAGSLVPSYAVVTSDLVCRIQELTGQVVEERGKFTTERRYVIYFEDRITVQAEDQIRDGSTIYQVVDYADPDSINGLMGVNAIRKL